jgi:hypothetical protein
MSASLRRCIGRCRFVIASLLAIAAVCVHAQEPSSLSKEFDKFSTAQKAEFNDYVDSADATYEQWLKQSWKSYDEFKAMVRDDSPKPDSPPNFKSAPQVESQADFMKDFQFSFENIQAAEKSRNILLQKANQNTQQVVFDLYGNAMQLPLIDAVAILPLTLNNEGDAAHVWDVLAKAPYVEVISQVRKYRVAYELSDWATLQLVKKYSEKISGNNNQQIVVQWFLLTKLGFTLRVGIDRGHAFLLINCSQMLYGKSYYVIDGDRYYLQSASQAGNLKIAPGYAGESIKSFNFSFAKSFKSELPWDSLNRDSDFKVIYNKARIQYFSDYPQLDLVYYFNAPVPKEVETALRSYWLQKVSNKPLSVQLSLMLEWVQNKKYLTDDAQFGKERYLLPEETLFYPAADCEDRSILLVWLITHILGVDAVGLNYPGHVSAAIKMPDDWAMTQKNSAAILTFKNHRYWSADPTYIGAPIGAVMAKFKTVKPEVIPGSSLDQK